MAKYKRVVTPEGIAHYPWLSKPDTKFDKNGTYSCNVFIDTKEAKPLIEMINNEVDEFHAAEEKSSKKTLERNILPYIEHGDSRDTNSVVPQGKVMFKIKQNGVIGDKPFRPHLVDAEGTPIVDKNGDNIVVYGGSKVKVAFDLYTYNNLKVGVTLKLVAVQVLELQDAGAPDISKLGFKKEEGFKMTEELTSIEDTGSAKKEEISNSDFI